MNHQDTKGTKNGKEMEVKKALIFKVFLGALGVLVVKPFEVF